MNLSLGLTLRRVDALSVVCRLGLESQPSKASEEVGQAK